MNLYPLLIAVAVAVSATPVAQEQRLVAPAGEFVQAVAANELSDRVQLLKWMYVIEKRVGNQALTEAQVETRSGPVYRLLAVDGAPLTPGQREKDDARISLLLSDTSQQSKLKKEYDDDEQMLETLLRVMPDAFLYDYDGADGEFVRLKFRPDPNYTPPTYQARVVHSLAGTVLIDPQQKRLAKLSGQIINRVEFGWGLFGHIDEGGTIEVGRVQVGPSHWKTALINVQLSGRLAFFKTIDKKTYETRSNFRPVSGELSLLQASQLLAR